MSLLWGALFCLGALYMLLTKGGDAALNSMLAGANDAVSLCLELAGAYLLFMGLTGVAKRARLLDALSNKMRGVTRFLLPNAGRAAGAVSVALAANILGLGNAATPLGIAAMQALNEVEPVKDGVATDDMCAFVAINASAPQLLPTGLLALRAAAGSARPAEIVLPSLLASCAATLVAVVLCRMQRRR